MTNKNKKGKKKKEVDKKRVLTKEREEVLESSVTPCELCGLPGSVSSPQVNLCSDCSSRHQHQGKHLPWALTTTEDEEKVLIASRAIKPLEVVVCDLALVTVPLTKLSCPGCGRAVSCRYTCPHCPLPLCGSQCPRAEAHSTECHILRHSDTRDKVTITPDGKNHPIFTAAGCIRLLELKKNDPKSFQKLRHLNRKLEQIKEDRAASEVLSGVKEILLPCQYEEQEVEEVFCLLKLYSYTLPDLEDGKVRSLFPVQSLISHSCVPNLQYIEAEGGRKIVLQATSGISAGSRLTVRLTPFLQGRISLTRTLRDHHYLSCSCPRCSDSTELGTFTSSALCDGQTCSEEGGLMLPINPRDISSDWICTSCQVITSRENVEAIEDKYIERFSLLSQGDLTAYYRFLNELGERFHASHHLVMRMAQFLVLLQGKNCQSLPRERIETQTMLCDKLLSYVSRLDPGATQNRAKLLLEKNKADLLLAKLDYEAGKISRNAFMSKIKEGVRIEVNAKKILYFKWED